jgi:hypothetical protein
MKQIILFLIIVCAAFSSMFFIGRGSSFEEPLGDGDLYHRPPVFAVVAAALASLWLMMALAAAVVE